MPKTLAGRESMGLPIGHVAADGKGGRQVVPWRTNANARQLSLAARAI